MRVCERWRGDVRDPGCRLRGRDGVRRAEWSGEPSAEAAVRVRGELHRLLTLWELDDEVVEDALLVVAELLANAVAHARTPFHLSARVEGPLLHVAVSDGRVGVPARSVNPTAGRVSGLRMVTAVAFRWGWHGNEAGKTIWAELIL